ncbi:MAG: TonB-dependent receptor, partial [Ignavibacteriaceae bacterium]
SGIVNAITKEGGSNYRGKISVYSGDHISTRDNTFFNVDNVEPLNDYVGELTLGGPIPFTNNNITFFISGRYEKDDGWLYGIREHTVYDSAYINPSDPNDVRIALSGDNAIVPMNASKNFSTTGKLTFKPASTVKINYDVLYSNSKYNIYNNDLKYNPDANYNYYNEGLLNSLEIRHAINKETFYTLKGSYSLHYYSKYLYPLLDVNGSEVDYYAGKVLDGLHPDPRYQPDYKLNKPSPYTYDFGGTQNEQNYERAQTFLGKFDLTSQVSSNHELKFGLQSKFNTLDYEYFKIARDSTRYLVPTIPSILTPDHDVYTQKPVELSVYIQDKMEFKNLILNAGIRYDYFNPKAVYSTNITYPSPNDPSLPDYIDKSSLLTDASAKHQISPRIGVSFPITDKGIIHFSYGHFFQMPPFQNLYSNSSFKYGLSTGKPRFGNANLKPEKQVTYEIGLQQQLFEDLAFNVTGFYKDVRDLLAIQSIRVSGDKTYEKYVNKDYGNVKGITFSLTKRRNREDLLGVTLDYTFQTAEGNDVNTDAFFLDVSSGRQSENVVIFLPWDQTHILNGTVSLGKAGNWNVSVIGRLGTGLPYTPETLEQETFVKTNSGRRPSSASVDLLAEKTFSINDLGIVIFLKVFNLFDTLNEKYVYNDTGRSTYSLFQSSGKAISADELAGRVPGVHSSEEYYNRPDYYYPPRQVKLGLSLEF